MTSVLKRARALLVLGVISCSAGTTGGGGPAGTEDAGGSGAAGASGSGVGGTGVAGSDGVGGLAGSATGGNAGSSGTGGASGASGASGTGGASGASGASGTGGGPSTGCTPPPSGTFQTRTVPGTGPNGGYTIVRPTTLGEGGFKHPPVAWGNGLGTTPPQYSGLLDAIASNGFVVIANPGPGSDPQVVRQGLEWLIAQNGTGEYAGMLAVDCAGTIGYSMGGGAAVGSGAHPAVKAIVSIHGIQGSAGSASGPILLLTSEGDDFVTIARFVQPTYDGSTTQPTFMAIHSRQASVATFGDHLEPLGTGGLDADPGIAWLRYWIYGDQAQRAWFFGADCTLCNKAPWVAPQRKNHAWE